MRIGTRSRRVEQGQIEPSPPEPRYLRRRRAEAATEAAVEIRHFAEAAGVRDVGHLQVIVAAICEDGACILQAQIQDAFGNLTAHLARWAVGRVGYAAVRAFAASARRLLRTSKSSMLMANSIFGAP
jgi:hypothetical protein